MSALPGHQVAVPTSNGQLLAVVRVGRKEGRFGPQSLLPLGTGHDYNGPHLAGGLLDHELHLLADRELHLGSQVIGFRPNN